MDDAQIIDLYDKRDQTAISFTSAKYANYCHSISYNIVKNREDADECLNDTWTQCWNTIPPAKPNSLKTYAGTICRNLSLNRYKANHTQKRGSGVVDAALDELSEILSNVANAEDDDNSEKIREVLNKFLGNLKEKERNVFVRRYWHLKTNAEIAEEYKLSEANVKQLLFRARNKLKKDLEKNGIKV